MSTPLSSREKNLSILVGAIAFLFVTFFVTDYFFKSKARLNADLAVKTRQLKTMQTLSAEKGLWEQRDVWLSQKQPKLVNEGTAGVQLLDQVKELAKKHVVTIENPKPQPAVRKPEYTAIVFQIETKSPWSELTRFLGELQTPEQFIALESANLKIDGADPTQMRGVLKIARWYAPK